MNFVFLFIMFLVIDIIFSTEAKARAVIQSTLRSNISVMDLYLIVIYIFLEKELFLVIFQLNEGF